MLVDGSGDLFAANVEALVNAVNTVGVMGKGLALAFKTKFPDNFAAYQRACKAGELVVGKMFVFDRAPAVPRWIINFPTKQHWRGQSKLEDIRVGLIDLVDQIRRLEIRSVAIPALGCGLGGLDWKDVGPLIGEACSAIPTTRCLVFAPR